MRCVSLEKWGTPWKKDVSLKGVILRKKNNQLEGLIANIRWS